MISRRALFGLSVGAVAAVKLPAVTAQPIVVGLDFGRRPAMAVNIPIRTGYAIELRDCHLFKSPAKAAT